MSENLCPNCSKELTWNGQYHCVDCNADFKKTGYCPACNGELEKLQACGAASYFCNQCNELKSKSKIQFEFQSIPHD